jgi:hypothetical protein
MHELHPANDAMLPLVTSSSNEVITSISVSPVREEILSIGGVTVIIGPTCHDISSESII